MKFLKNPPQEPRGIEYVVNVIDEATDFDALFPGMNNSEGEALASTLMSLGVISGIVCAALIGWGAAWFLTEFPQARTPMALGAVLGFVPAIAMVRGARGSVWGFGIRLFLFPFLGLVVGALVGAGL